jgi:hypothetical protein
MRNLDILFKISQSFHSFEMTNIMVLLREGLYVVDNLYVSANIAVVNKLAPHRQLLHNLKYLKFQCVPLTKGDYRGLF